MRMSDAEIGKSGDYDDDADEREEEEQERERHHEADEEESCSAFRPEQYEATIRSLEDQVNCIFYFESGLSNKNGNIAKVPFTLTEGEIKVCTWLRELSSCSCLTVLPGPAWVLLSKTPTPE